MNKEWYQHILREQLLPTIQEHFEDEQCFFQHDGAPSHKANVITNWLGEQNIDILGPWQETPHTLISLRTCGQSSRGGWTNKNPQILKLQALILQERAAISQNVAQKLIDSMPGRIAEVLKMKGHHCKY